MAFNSFRSSAVDAPDRALREIVTPEGVAITVRLADRSERVAALIIDLMVIAGVALGLAFVSFWGISAGGSSGFEWLASIGMLVWFALRSFYFIALELRWQGKTVGKRALGLRVIDRAGGRLGADAVFARNLMREVEVFIPISLLFADSEVGVELWIQLCSIVWAAVFVLLPLFNRDRLRAGDIVAGTWVVAAPRAALLPDMATGWKRFCARMAPTSARRARWCASASETKSAGPRPTPRSTPIGSWRRSMPRSGRGSKTACCSATAARTNTIETETSRLVRPDQSNTLAMSSMPTPSLRTLRS